MGIVLKIEKIDDVSNEKTGFNITYDSAIDLGVLKRSAIETIDAFIACEKDKRIMNHEVNIKEE